MRTPGFRQCGPSTPLASYPITLFPKCVNLRDFADILKVPNQLTLTKGDHPGRPDLTTRAL